MEKWRRRTLSFFRVGDLYRGLYQVEYTVRFFSGELAVARKGAERFYLQSVYLQQPVPPQAIEQYLNLWHPFVLPYLEVFVDQNVMVFVRPYSYIHPLREVISIREINEDQVIDWGEKLLKLEIELKAKPLRMYLLLDPRNVGLDEDGNLRVIFCGLQNFTAQPNKLDWGSFFYTLLSGVYLEEPLRRIPPHFPVSRQMGKLIYKSLRNAPPEMVLSQIEAYKRKKNTPGLFQRLFGKGKKQETGKQPVNQQVTRDQPPRLPEPQIAGQLEAPGSSQQVHGQPLQPVINQTQQPVQKSQQPAVNQSQQPVQESQQPAVNQSQQPVQESQHPAVNQAQQLVRDDAQQKMAEQMEEIVKKQSEQKAEDTSVDHEEVARNQEKNIQLPDREQEDQEQSKPIMEKTKWAGMKQSDPVDRAATSETLEKGQDYTSVIQEQETQIFSPDQLKAELEKIEQKRLERLQDEFKKRQEELLKKQRAELERRQQEILEKQRQDFEKTEEELLRKQKEEFEQQIANSKPESALENTGKLLELERIKWMEKVEEIVQERLENEKREREKQERELLEQERREWEEQERKRIQEEQSKLLREELKKLESERLEWQKKRQELEEKEKEMKLKLEQEFEQMMKEMLAKQAEEFERRQQELLEQQRQWLENKTKERLEQQRRELEQASSQYLTQHSTKTKSLLNLPPDSLSASSHKEQSEQLNEKERYLREQYERENREHEQLAKQFEDYMKNWRS